MDDDLQNPPEEIPKLMEAIERSDLDVISGTPEGRKHSWARNAGSLAYRWLVSLIFKYEPVFQDFRDSWGWPRAAVEVEYLYDQIMEYASKHPELDIQ